MRLLQHINEGSDAEVPFGVNMEEVLHSECKPYLKLIKGKNPLFRGMEYAAYEIGTKKVRKNRTPFGMEHEHADTLNHWLQKNKHVRRDESMLCTPDVDHTGLFGSPYMVFPIGRLRYTWFNGPDVNMDGHSGWTQDTIAAWYFTQHPDRQEALHLEDYVDKAMDKLDKPFEWFFTSNKGFSRAYKNDYEFWIECDKYYYADATSFKWDSKRQTLVPDE